MVAIQGIYDGHNFYATEKVPTNKQCKVIITFVEEENNMSELEASADMYASLFAEDQEAKEWLQDSLKDWE